MSTSTSTRAASAAPAARPPGLPWRKLGASLSFGNIGAVYVLAVIVVAFCAWIPDVFMNLATAQQILNSSAITALAALSIVIPLATQTFDLSIGFVMSLSGVTAAYFVAHTSLPLPIAVALALGAALVVGLINATVVVIFKIDSFIATLATGSLIEAFITMVTNENPITSARLTGPFASIAQGQLLGLTLPVFYALAVAAAVWYFLQHTVSGRRMYATGFNADAARLAQIGTGRLRFAALLMSALLAGVGGIVLASSITSGDPSAGTAYLLPAYAAAFVGATQLQRGRFNAWGTVIAVLLLATGTTGLSLAAAPDWAGDMFTGVVLIAALAVTGRQRRASSGSRGRWFGLRTGSGQAAAREALPAAAPSATATPPTG